MSDWLERALLFPLTAFRWGFRWGPLLIQRVASDPKYGVVIWVGSEHKQYEVRVSPKGRTVTVHECEGVYWSEEWRRVMAREYGVETCTLTDRTSVLVKTLPIPRDQRPPTLSFEELAT